MLGSGSDCTSLAQRPRFSVVIPTRDRPQYARNAVESVLMQSFRDFEVVVCDNFEHRACDAEINTLADPRVRYLTPPHPLAMHDNWEFAIDQARGDFVLILIDKTMLRPSALERLQAATVSHPADVYSWTADAYYLTREREGDVGTGYLVPVRGAGDPFYVHAADEIAARVSFRQRLGTEGPSYAYGKICFGAFSRTLIARIKERFGKVCPLISPDYTSKTLALLSVDRLVDLNGSYLINLITSISNGMQFSQSSAHARRFLAQGGFTEQFFDQLPIPNVFCSVHNICAYDWRMMNGVKPHADQAHNVDLAALYWQVEQDLTLVKEWASEDERAAIGAHMNAFLLNAAPDLRERIFAFRLEMSERVYVQREQDLADRAKLIDARESAVLAREELIAVRENAVVNHEASVQRREAALKQIEHLLKPLLWPLVRMRSVARAMSHPKQIETALERDATLDCAESPSQSKWPVVGGYPIFASTGDALRYAESQLYTFPMPVSPEPGHCGFTVPA